MDKKTKMIVIVVIAVVVLGGLFYGYNRWRQQQLANQILKAMYGGNTGLLSGGLTPDKIAQEIAKEAAKEEARQKKDEAKEAAKTPEDRYNATEEMATYDANSKAAADGAKSIIEKAFGKTKLTSFYSNNYGADNFIASSMEFAIARLATGADLGELNKALVDKGLPIIQSGISDKTATITAGDNETATYSFSFEIGGQTVSASAMSANQ